jgi:hypothetical protein
LISRGNLPIKNYTQNKNTVTSSYWRYLLETNLRANWVAIASFSYLLAENQHHQCSQSRVCSRHHLNKASMNKLYVINRITELKEHNIYWLYSYSHGWEYNASIFLQGEKSSVATSSFYGAHISLDPKKTGQLILLARAVSIPKCT